MEALEEMDIEDVCDSPPRAVNEEEYYQPEESSKKSQDSEVESNDGGAKHSDSSQTLKTEDFQMMIQNYKLIGGELEYNIKLLETKWQALNQQLIQRVDECDLLNQTKEFHKKTLLDLQIRMENLDSELLKYREECLKDKSLKTQTFTHEVHSILENDEYLRNTYNKFFEILQQEKGDFDNFLKNSKSLAGEHTKTGQDYFNEISSIKSSVLCKFSTLLEDEANLCDALDQGLEKCKIIKENEAKLSQQIHVFEEEIKAASTRNEFLKATLEKSKALLSECESEYKRVKLEENQNFSNITEEISKIEANYADIISKCKENSEKLSNLIVEQSSLSDAVQDYLEKISESQVETANQSEELEQLTEEHNSLSEELRKLQIDKDNMLGISGRLPTVSEALTELQSVETTLEESIRQMKEDILGCETRLNELKANEESVQKESDDLSRHIWDCQHELRDSEAEFQYLFNASTHECENLSIKLSEKYLEIDTLERETEQLTATESGIDTELRSVGDEYNSLVLAGQDLEGVREKLAEEVLDITSIENEISSLKDQVEKLSSTEVGLDGDLAKVSSLLEEGAELHVLEAESKQITIEMEEATLRHKEQMETMQMSYDSQRKNLESKSIRELKELERRTGKEEARTRRMNEALPRLNAEIKTCETSLRKAFPKIIQLIQVGLKKMEELSDFYYHSLKKASGKKVSDHQERNLTSINEQFSAPMKCMMSLDGVPRISLDKPAFDSYRKVIEAFKKKYVEPLQHYDGNAPLEMAKKLREIGGYMFGKKWVEPSPQENLNDTEISSSTEINFND